VDNAVEEVVISCVQLSHAKSYTIYSRSYLLKTVIYPQSYPIYFHDSIMAFYHIGCCYSYAVRMVTHISIYHKKQAFIRRR